MRTYRMAYVLLALLLLLVPVLAYAQGGGFGLKWWTVDGGGGTGAGGAYALSGTLGQPDAGSMSGGGYTLVGGFWSGVETTYRFYMPLAPHGHR